MESPQRVSAIIETKVKNITLASLPNANLEDKYKILEFIDQGTFGKVFKVMRKSDSKIMAAKCIPLNEDDINFELLKLYAEREISFLSGLDNEFILKLEDQCFISGATEAIN